VTIADMVDLAAKGRGRFYIDRARPNVVRFESYDDRSKEYSLDPFPAASEARKWLVEHQP
jgi:hypothetical protein